MQFLVSAGEASGDLYAAGVVDWLARIDGELRFYGCAGPHLQAAGVEPVIDASQLAVVGLAEVVGHLPRIYREYRRLLRFIRANKPVAALLTDSPDFHLRLARHLKRWGVPVYYLVAPQVWAWRQGRVKQIARLVDKLFCLFPFEEEWFRARGVDAIYIGHPLARMVRPKQSREEFFVKHGIDPRQKMIVLLPGSRAGEIKRHLPALLETVELLRHRCALTVLLATPGGFAHAAEAAQSFREPAAALSIKIVENETWDCIAYSDLALAASGTVTVEAAILGTPMVTFYRVSRLSWEAGRRFVKVPFLSMVNLIAGRKIVPELMQDDMTPQALAAAAADLLNDESAARHMRSELAAVQRLLTPRENPFERTARLILHSPEVATR